MSSSVPLPMPSRPSKPPVVRGPSFARGLWRIAAADASSGNRVELMRNGPRTFDAMIAAIDGARESVSLESYMVVSDSVGNRFANALIAAAARGVRVRMIADWIGSRQTTRAFWRRLREGKVEYRIFSPPGFRSWLGLLPRDHRKLLVVDDAVGITGGIGLGEAWSGLVAHRKRAPWRDTAAGGGGPPAPETARGAVVGIVEGEPWRLRIARALQIQAVAAERFIWIASAYFYPSYAELEALAGAAQDGVDVRILVPSSYDHPWVRRLTRRVYRRLLSNGVRIWEWNGIMMHAKTSVVDGRWVRVGSTDFNPLGVAINFELDALIEDQSLGREAEALFLADLG